ncbi:hypothetical protein HUT19_41400 (plasmid) [Streptomyces sp. NA02950]|uniref:hypothetical protein n=1 Tax=Streptomyces sp. NA02950 TaxID=2742137 RepID=UPI0015901084|nr:hypothetical protein [Streptomyces sp. NA02950]QKV98180.1 hypothetical protein HUT19_41400 [Streptomyces sp. NA02950]
MSTPTVNTTTAPAAVDALPPYVSGLEAGRDDAANTAADVVAVRLAWITEFADAEYADGYRAGLDFDRRVETAFRTRRGRA